MRGLRDLYLRGRALIAPGRVERELGDELSFHVEREMHSHIAAGLSPAEARRRALARFGPMALAADQCRDVRGTAAIETLVRDVQYALRSLRRAPLVAFTIVATVGLGLGLVTVVFSLYNVSLLRVDAVRSPEELFAVRRPTVPGSDATFRFTRQEYEAIRRGTGVFSDIVATLRPARARLDGRIVSGALVTGNYFQALGVSAVIGRPLAPDDDAPDSALPVIVLSHWGWSTLFGGDPTVIGRLVRLNGLPYEVIGVMPEGFRGLALGPPDFWAPLGLVGRFRRTDAGQTDTAFLEVIGRLRPGLSRGSAAAALGVWASEQADLRGQDGQPLRVTLEPRQGTISADLVEVVAVFGPIFFAFGLILMIGCANVANLLLARGVLRQREIGIRLSIGSSRGRIVRLLLTESLVLSLAAAAVGFVVSRAAQAGAIRAVTATMPAELLGLSILNVPPTDWRVVAFLVVGAFIATLAFGIAPAIQATRLELVRTIRGEVTRDGRTDRARQILVAVQVGASALLLVCAAVLLHGSIAAASADPGVRTSDTLLVPGINEAHRPALLQAFAVHPAVATVAASSPRVLAVAEAPGKAAADGSASTRREAVEQTGISPDYLGVLGIDLVAGRGFTPTERTIDAGVAIVSETIARLLWPGVSAVGRAVRLDAESSKRSLTVVGVVRDVKGPMAADLFPTGGVFVPTAAETPGTSWTLRVRGDPEQARQTLIADLMRVDPGLGEITTLQTIARLQAYVLRIAFWVAVVLGVLALVLTASGLFSVLSYIVEQRSRDIGVHMALGATSTGAVRLVLSHMLYPVGLGLAAGVGLAASVATVLMAVTDAEIGTLLDVFDPAAYAGSVVVVLGSCVLAALAPALRAARIDPITTLRQD